jgi:drug/metabolite transporter (DMT)-like permease
VGKPLTDRSSMELHRPTGRRALGLGLACATMLLWGVLPLALELMLRAMDAITITWYRFLISSLILGGILAWNRRLPPLSHLGGRGWLLLAVATLFLATNYVAYLVGLDLTSAANAQVLIQLAPLLLALGGLVVFREHFTRLQWIGLAVLVAGLGLFFADQLRALAANADRYLLGTLIMVGAAATWAVYGLAQKQLLHWLPSQGIVLCLYLGCTLVLWPLAEPGTVVRLDGTHLALLLFCALNTVLAYGAFAEALSHWEASRVSAVLALTPLATLAFIELADLLWPGLLEPEHLSATSVVGALVVVAGSVAASFGGGRRPGVPS